MTTTPAQAASTLSDLLDDQPWFRGVARGQASTDEPALEGEPVLIVYVARPGDQYKGLPREWEGYPVLVRVERGPT